MPTLISICEEQAAWTREVQEKLGDTCLQLSWATEISRDDTAWRAELRGRIYGLQFSLEAARREAPGLKAEYDALAKRAADTLREIRRDANMSATEWAREAYEHTDHAELRIEEA